MLRRDSQRPIEEMSEFMERRAGLRNVDGFLAVVGGSNAAHVQLLASSPQFPARPEMHRMPPMQEPSATAPAKMRYSIPSISFSSFSPISQ